jgi:hypothetical protein
MSLVLLGLACVGLGDYDAGERHLTEIHALQWERRILMDWIWKLPLHQGLCELHIARRDWASAEREVPIFQKLSAATAEATWQANAYIAAATISVETEHWTTAQEMIRKGSAAISGFDAPLAEWRLHWLAFRTSHATESALKAQDGIYRLANSLERDSSLREKLLSRRTRGHDPERTWPISRRECLTWFKNGPPAAERRDSWTSYDPTIGSI